MTLGHEWQDTSGRSHHSRSCEELGRVYTLLADRLLKQQDSEIAIKMLTKAYEMAKECTHFNTRSSSYSLRFHMISLAKAIGHAMWMFPMKGLTLKCS